MKSQKKMDILIETFQKLDEGCKDYIQELTQNLVEIHCGGGFLREYEKESTAHCKKLGVFPV